MLDDLRNEHGERLDFTFTPGTVDSSRVVVVSHGVTSSKERPWQVRLCDRLADAGVASLRFTFAGNLGSDGSFEQTTLSKEVEDLGSVIDALPRSSEVFYAGHSMGSAVGVLRAAVDPRIRGLVSLAGMVRVHEFMQRVFGHLELGEPMLGKSHCPWNAALRDDAQRIGDVLDAGSRVRCPWLLVHGTADELVPFAEATEIRDAVGGRAELVAFEGVDHRFSQSEDAMADVVVDWLARR